ncbi:expressed unknown protein [Seminavis robusta]|uniref:Uncharacterized protein n=1 Tax=Seminavis robusta TaxID=568900 RepID=A0A9N8E9G9_9STRA|nr:expressed unknown protein [Seminavis robusta]|eukprot:Sro842_g209640.1 n/a (110) ;mRNA; f:4625-4954
MNSLRFLIVLALLAVSSVLAEKPGTRGLQGVGNCPDTAPDFGQKCRAGLQCNYGYLDFPVNSNGVCAEPFTCSPTVFCECTADKTYICAYASIAACENELEGAFASCVP